jgi:hypothetical protein
VARSEIEFKRFVEEEKSCAFLTYSTWMRLIRACHSSPMRLRMIGIASILDPCSTFLEMAVQLAREEHVEGIVRAAKSLQRVRLATKACVQPLASSSLAPKILRATSAQEAYEAKCPFHVAQEFVSNLGDWPVVKDLATLEPRLLASLCDAKPGRKRLREAWIDSLQLTASHSVLEKDTDALIESSLETYHSPKRLESEESILRDMQETIPESVASRDQDADFLVE